MKWLLTGGSHLKGDCNRKFDCIIIDTFKSFNSFNTSHNFCRLLSRSAYILRWPILQTIWTHIRQVPKEQSDQGSEFASMNKSKVT